MFSKQDAVRPRTAEDLERKYNLAETNRLIAENVKTIAESNKAVAQIKRSVSDQEATIKSLAEWKDGTEESITQIKQTASDQGASITSLTEWKDDTTDSLAIIDQRSKNNEASITLLSKFEGGEGVESLAELIAKANANEASVKILNEWKGEVEDDVESISSISSTASGAAAQVEVLNQWKGKVEGDVESISSIKSTAEGAKAQVDILNEWKGGVEKDVESISEIKSIADESHAGIELLVEYSADGTPTASGKFLIEAINGESSAQISADRLEIDGKKLNIKVDATNIEGELTIGKQIPDSVAEKKDIPTKTSDLTNDSDFATTGQIPTNMSQLTNDAKIAYTSDILTKLSQMQNDIGLQDEAGVTKIVGGIITADYINALGIIAKALSVGDLAAVNATIGKWNITENGLYADNNTVGLNGSEGNPIRMYAGLEKRSVGTVQLSSSDFRKTQLSDGWYAYNGTILDSGGEVVGAVAYTLSFPNGVPGNIIATNFGGMFEGYPGRAGSASPLSVRNVSATYYADTNQVVIDYFESEISAIYEHFFSFDLVCAVSEKDANFRVHGDGTVDAAMLNAEEARCQSVTIDGVKLSRKTAAVTGVTTTKQLQFAVTIEGKKIKVYEIWGEHTGLSKHFWINYTLNSGTSFESHLQGIVIVPQGQSFGTLQVPCRLCDTISNVLFHNGEAAITITETISEEYAPEYIDVENAVKVERLKIGNYELTEDKLQRLLALL